MQSRDLRSLSILVQELDQLRIMLILLRLFIPHLSSTINHGNNVKKLDRSCCFLEGYFAVAGR
ncbi:MAG: hypothetical protein ACI915_003919 [Gammaproteobacteria bacterium]|jgi:hypothetical protein